MAVGTMKVVGTVKWFNSAKGFGFICLEDGQNVFAHFSTINMDGYRCLRAGEQVTFQLNQGTKGLYATEIDYVAAKVVSLAD